ncbi:MAG TPA: hypothetical protein EYG93_11065, partial [Sulfurospirillum arcachonense]|nr:hypothetical protein [Sulfurospirillum arcachonense]
MSASIDIVTSDNTIVFTCKGSWTLEYVTKLSKQLDTTFKEKKITFDLKQLTDFDTHGVLLLIESIKKLKLQNCKVEKIEESEKFLSLYEVCLSNFPQDIKSPLKHNSFTEFFYGIGKIVIESKKTLI